MTTTLDESAIATLRQKLRGDVITPGRILGRYLPSSNDGPGVEGRRIIR